MSAPRAFPCTRRAFQRVQSRTASVHPQARGEMKMFHSHRRAAPAASPRRRQRGNALVFSMLGLVIGGIVLALGIGYYQNSQANAQVQGTISEISAIIGGAQQNYG